MNRICVSAIFYFIEFAKMYIVTERLLGVRQRKQVVPAFVVSLLLILGGTVVWEVASHPMLYGIVACVVLIATACEKKQAGLIVLFCMGIGVIDVFFAIVFGAIFRLNLDILNQTTWVKVCVNTISLLLVWVTGTLLHRQKIRHTVIIHERKYMPVYLLTGIALALYLGSVPLLGEKMFNYSHFHIFVFALTGMALVIIGDLLLINNTKNIHLKEEADLQANLLEVQKEYYTMLLLKENETKAFRHDIKNHVNCMQNLCQEGQYEELETYLAGMETEVDRLLPKTETGNPLITAIVNNTRNQFPTVPLRWRGMMPEEIRISSVDICTIVSNLLMNAFEAASQCETPMVDVQIKFLESTMMIVVANSFAMAPLEQEGEFVSSKMEEGHGYGIRNVKRCVEKNRGKYSVSMQGNVFTTKVILPGSR